MTGNFHSNKFQGDIDIAHVETVLLELLISRNTLDSFFCWSLIFQHVPQSETIQNPSDNQILLFKLL